MRPKALLAAAALAVTLAACDAGSATAPDSVLHPAGPVAEGVGQMGSGGATPPPPDSTRP